jgi:hypothetical protein
MSEMNHSRVPSLQSLADAFARLVDELRPGVEAVGKWAASVDWERVAEVLPQMPLALSQEVERDLTELMLRTGFPAPPNLPYFMFHVSLDDMRTGSPAALRREIRQGHRVDQRGFRCLRDLLRESSLLQPSRPLLRQTFGAYRRREWYLVINALMPLVEGLLSDISNGVGQSPQHRKTHEWVGQLKEAELDTARRVCLIGIMLFASAPRDTPAGKEARLIDYIDFTTYIDGGRALNRHVVAHGIARRGYGTEENALRLLLVLACIVGLHEGDTRWSEEDDVKARVSALL